jgi:hypothetical protein
MENNRKLRRAEIQDSLPRAAYLLRAGAQAERDRERHDYGKKAIHFIPIYNDSQDTNFSVRM